MLIPEEHSGQLSLKSHKFTYPNNSFEDKKLVQKQTSSFWPPTKFTVFAPHSGGSQIYSYLQPMKRKPPSKSSDTEVYWICGKGHFMTSLKKNHFKLWANWSQVKKIHQQNRAHRKTRRVGENQRNGNETGNWPETSRSFSHQWKQMRLFLKTQFITFPSIAVSS